MVGGIRFEHTHRVVAATVGLLTLILTFWIGFTERRSAVRRLAIGALAAVVLQGILGGLTVIYRLPTAISVTHACLGPIFFAVVSCLAVILSPKWPADSGTSILEYEERQFQSLSSAAVLLVFFQMLLGAVVRHSGEAVSYHVLTAIFVFMLAGMLVAKSVNYFSDRPEIFRPALFLGLLVVLEFFLGIGAFIFTRMEGISHSKASVLFPTLHQTLGALILAASAVLALRATKLGVISVEQP
jgi:cytochrome c oxidase assembly protein subunit 15